jgi:hypothetical protein
MRKMQNISAICRSPSGSCLISFHVKLFQREDSAIDGMILLLCSGNYSNPKIPLFSN